MNRHFIVTSTYSTNVVLPPSFIVLMYKLRYSQNYSQVVPYLVRMERFPYRLTSNVATLFFKQHAPGSWWRLDSSSLSPTTGQFLCSLFIQVIFHFIGSTIVIIRATSQCGSGKKEELWWPTYFKICTGVNILQECPSLSKWAGTTISFFYL